MSRLSDRLGDDGPRRGRTTRSTAAEEGRWQQTRTEVRRLLVEELTPKLAAGTISGDRLEEELVTALDRILRSEKVRVSPRERRAFVAEVLSDVLGYGPLDPLLADPSVTEIMCNDFDDIWVERDGKLEHTDVRFSDPAHYRQVVDKIVAAVGRRLDEATPMVDARLPDGSRVNVIIPPLALDGVAMTIRKFPEQPLTAADLIASGTLSADLAMVLEASVRGRLNILISGGTATGKTTLLNILSAYIPDGERIITIEDAAELRLQQPHVVRLEARPPNIEGRGEVTIRDLVRNALRMRPDRIIVGEVRGAEALDMLQAMNTGHEGSLTTIHANSPRDALRRLETLVLFAGTDLPSRAIREQIASALDLVVQLDRVRGAGRRVTSVHEIQGMEGDTIISQELFRYEHRRDSKGREVGEVVATGLRPHFLERLADEGVELPVTVFRGTRTPEARRRRR